MTHVRTILTSLLGDIDCYEKNVVTHNYLQSVHKKCVQKSVYIVRIDGSSLHHITRYSKVMPTMATENPADILLI